MADIFTVKKRKRIMSSIKGRNTTPEKTVRHFLRKLGCRFKTYDKELPGNPDIIIKRRKKVIFVHGCFWHGHKNCIRAALPGTNRAFWKKKIQGNVLRDEKTKRQLRRLGWEVMTIWQCRIKDTEKLNKELADFVKRSK